MDDPRQAYRFMREISAPHVWSRASCIAFIESQVQDVQHRAQTLSTLFGRRQLEWIPDSLMVCFARLMRCAIVASGTKNALAISAVVKPPTARSVKAIAEEGVRAGWQHMKRRTSVSSS